MQNLFISPDDEFVINFCVAIDKNNVIYCDLERKSLVTSLENMDKKVEDFSIEEYHATFKKPSFGDVSKLYDEIFMSADGESIPNPMIVRYNKIAALIKSWDLKGTKEKPEREEIMALHPVIAMAIGLMLDLETDGIFN